MRASVAAAILGVLVVATTAHAQRSPCAPLAYSYDPYKPSDAAIMRQYGAAMLSQAPLSTLLKLDPYVPSEAALLRQFGGGIPLWPAFPWYSHMPVALPANCAPVPEPPSTAAAPLTSMADVLAILDQEGATRAAGASPVAVAPGPGPQADTNKGVWISYAGRTWVSAGSAVRFVNGEFVLAGDSAGFPVFRRAGASDDLIFVPTTRGMVAPFRAAP